MTPSTYLLRLTRRFLGLGGKIRRGRLVSLEPLKIRFAEDQEEGLSSGINASTTPTSTFSSEGNTKARTIPDPSTLGNIENLILCIGIGASSLPGLSEKEKQRVFPVTGQVVRIQAPWVKEGFTRQVGSLGGSRTADQEGRRQGYKGGNKECNKECNKDSTKELDKEEQTDREGGEGGQRTYIIPRGNGEVILGGTRDIDLW